MFFRLPLLLVRRVALPTAAPRFALTRPFSYTPSAFAAAKPKEAVVRPKASAKSKAATKPKPKPKAKAKSTAKATTSGRKKRTKTAKKSPFTKSQLKVPIRRPPSAYIMYITEQSAKMPKTTTLLETADRTKNLAAQWNTLSKDQQQIYYEKSNALAPKIKADFDAWLKNVDPAALRKINKKRKDRGKQRIIPFRGPRKGPLPPFMSFLGDFRAENPTVTGKEMGIQGGAAWRVLPQARKDVYLSAYKNAKKAQEAKA